jgi:carboxypeptidase PM20D1
MVDADTTDAGAARPGIAERLSRLIQLDTVSSTVVAHGSGEFEELLAELYPLVHRLLRKESIGERGFLFTWDSPVEQAAADPIVLMAHYDTVPTGDPTSWRRPPLSGAIEDGTVFGRGAIDDKGALVVMLDAVENLLAAGFRPARPVLISLGGDEETYGRSARAIADELHARGTQPWLVLDEGGAIIDGPLPALPHETAIVGVGEKGVASVRLTATAVPGHSSTPSRTPSAPERVARAVTRLRRNPFAKRINATTRAMFAAYDGVARGAGRALITLVPRLGPIAARTLAWRGGEPAAMVQTTIATTVLEGGGAHNVIPERASAVLNLRIAPGETVDSVVATLRRAVRDPAIEFDVIEGHDPSPISRTDSAQWRAIANAATAAYPGVVVAPYVMLAASDARHFHRYATEATYRLAPLRMSASERAGLHGIDERVTIDALERGERFYRELLVHLPA